MLETEGELVRFLAVHLTSL